MNPMSPLETEQEVEDSRLALKEELQGKMEQASLELKEVTMMLEQSRVEVSRLAQRNASATTQLQQVYAQFDSLPRADIRGAYETAMEAQQRLFLMRGQLEKMHSDQAHLERFVRAIEKALYLVEESEPPAANARGPSARAEVLEMLIGAQEAERQRLSRQMHDGPAQALSNFILQTEIATRLFETDKAKAHEELLELKDTATSAFQKVRDFIFELRPMMLDDLGLFPTVERYVAAYKEQTAVDISLTLTGAERRLESFLEVMIFRAMQELLSTAVNRSQATQARVQVDSGDSFVRVVVEDNGRGFELDAVDNEQGMGINLIRERVEMVGGQFSLESQPGQGMYVSFQVPTGEAGGL
jgi:two-component system, NarL family, sensor histidine kinase DegS